MGEISLTQNAWYWVKETEGSDWFVARYSCGEWHTTGSLVIEAEELADIVGPIPKPEGRWIIPKRVLHGDGSIVTFE